MIIGVGTDIVEIDRIRRAMARHDRFLKKLFTENEIEYFRTRKLHPQNVAGNFAAKEAIVKAMGTGLRGFEWTDIEIIRDELGKPEVHLHGNAHEVAIARGVDHVHLSISHSRKYATAHAVAECKGGAA